MRPHPTQFGARENTASSRQHDSRLEVNARRLQPDGRHLPLRDTAPTPTTSQTPPNEATVVTEKDQLLSVQDVAALLQVPVSWVYGRTRQRSTDRIPGFRLGKYWRFNRQDVTGWLAAKSTKLYPNA